MRTFQLPVQIQTVSIRMPGVNIVYPAVSGLPNRSIEHSINRTIQITVYGLQQEQQKYQTGTLSEMIGHYEIKTNERGILSLILTNYAYSKNMAHGYTAAKSLTFNTMTGHLYSLSDLFKPGADYEAVLTPMILTQIKKRDIPLLDDSFHSIRHDQDYYLADKALVVYFKLYEITPYYVGFPMFPISVYDVLGIAADHGPLDVLAQDIA